MSCNVQCVNVSLTDFVYLIWEWLLWPTLASGVMGEHNLDLYTQYPLAKVNVCDSAVNVFPRRVPGVDHEPVHKLHGLCPLASELSGDNDLTTFCSTLHDETQHTIASSGEEKRGIVSWWVGTISKSPSHSQPSNQFVT